VAIPALLETRILPESSEPTILLALKVRDKVESESTSTRPFPPKLIIADEFVPVTMVLPELIVALDTTGCPLTETVPLTVISPIPSFGAAKTVIEYTHKTATAVKNVIDLRIILVPSID
jgi:hypothetical protein